MMNDPRAHVFVDVVFIAAAVALLVALR